ncbi:hypothetical protein IU421_19370 [Nocardia cyriacigeorgica]|uniref:hypothetical protein n=1 Tax=Nocardia cyriacigeorgica TaxID=135487 RepID=UPI0018943561|nr:hypothetical protein [Nocardia cyriacigeorgica]MBF6161164.1 hypothetical protein [Nocardia cyriacigeorgica]MBF6199963.1 hypothetical protein [Nocardia cyriacigeorgica]MBF6319873.1 hypothetical protein [Nocardia cyriacigeorgica]MBF6343728.1 hypothetical protein [Nocardia cyriacigeorgica]MBF6516418.1 hypothetical protein [Nocardia cyriacigeorgica]
MSDRISPDGFSAELSATVSRSFTATFTFSSPGFEFRLPEFVFSGDLENFYNTAPQVKSRDGEIALDRPRTASIDTTVSADTVIARVRGEPSSMEAMCRHS